MNKIKAIFIDPDNKTVSTVELTPKDGDIDLEECYKLMECNLVEFVYFGEKEILILDEEGLLRDKIPFFIEGVGQQYFCGKALIVQEDDEVCTSVEEDRIEAIVKMISFPEIEEED